MMWWIAAVLLILVIIKIYSKVTCGMCTSTARLPGRVVIVTGSNTGIGYETAKDLARRGARVILACRDEKKAIEARDRIIEVTGNKQVVYMHLDLASNKSVRNFVAEFLRNESRLDVLVNNAGVAAVGNVNTQDGVLLEFQINHYGPFLLTNLLLPSLKASAPSRIVNVASYSHWLAATSLEGLTKYNHLVGIVYANTKLCNILFTKELARRLAGTGVVANVLHPGLVVSDIYRNTNWLLRKFTDWYNQCLFKTTWEGAQTSIYLAVAPECANVSGKYFTDCQPGWQSWKGNNTKLAKELWEHSEKIVKFENSAFTPNFTIDK